MTDGEIKHGWLGTRFKSRMLIHLIMFSTMINGAISDHGHSFEMETSGKKWPENPGQIYQADHSPDSNKTISSESGEFDSWMFENEVEKVGRNRSDRSLRLKLGERFAFRKRLQFALLPIMYKMGVMTTLLTGLTILVLKGLTIGVILLIFAFGNYFTKLHKHSYQSTQPIHVHVHSQDGHSKVTSFPYATGPWDRLDDEIGPAAFVGDDQLESYRKRLVQNSAALLKSRPLQIQ